MKQETKDRISMGLMNYMWQIIVIMLFAFYFLGEFPLNYIMGTVGFILLISCWNYETKFMKWIHKKEKTTK